MSPKKENDMSPEEPEVTCPVCGNVVTLDEPFCPHCGAEFEEEEVEEIVEVSEDEAEAAEAKAEEEPVEAEAEETTEEEADEEAEEEAGTCAAPGEAAPVDFKKSLIDKRTFGIMLLLLGIICTQIDLFVSWYWTWVPPITSNLAMYLIIAIIVIVVGLLSFKLASDRANAGKKMQPIAPLATTAIFLFGILAAIMFLVGGPISSAMGGSYQIAIGILFIVLIVVGILLFMMGDNKASEEKKAA